MVDLDIKLLIGAVARTGPEPVLVNASTGDVGLWKVGHHLLRHRVNQIAGDIGVGTARARIGGDVIEGNEGAARYSAIERSGVWVPNLTSIRTASSGAIERSSLCGAKFAKITGPHRVAGNSSSSRAQSRLSQAVVIEEEESLVLEDRAANGATIIVAAQRRNGISIAVCEPVVCIEAIVAQELVHAAVKLVRAGARDHIDHRGTGKSVFRAKIRLLNFEFFHCLR